MHSYPLSLGLILFMLGLSAMLDLVVDPGYREHNRNHRKVRPPMFDCTSGDIYEIARTQGGGDPIMLSNQCLAVKMREDFYVRTVEGVIEREGTNRGLGGDYLIVNNQKMQRVVCPAAVFELLFDVRQ